MLEAGAIALSSRNEGPDDTSVLEGSGTTPLCSGPALLVLPAAKDQGCRV